MNSETTLRMGVFFGVLIIMALWEIIWPKRPLAVSKVVRWYSNLGIVLLDSFLVRLFFPIMAIGLADIAAERQWGLLNNFSFPFIPAVILSVIFLDMVIYFQHLVFHAVPMFWRLHRMHHTDLDYDVTTALRFHPIEISLSMLVKMSVVVVLGPPVLAVLIFEILLNASAMFNHGNVRLPQGIDNLIRHIFVTPDMHRVHHSEIRKETDSNFGFCLSWWDIMFGTYRAQPEKGHEAMIIGTGEFLEQRFSHLHWLLIQPFIDRK